MKHSMVSHTQNSKKSVLLISTLILITIAGISLFLGKYPLSLSGILNNEGIQRQVFVTLRLSRVITGVIGGIALGISGYVLQTVLKNEFGNRAVIFTSKPYFLEILPPNCGKGEAITWLANHIGLDPATTMAFGDSMNDESIIRLCGYGVAMKNGLEEIKKAADFVTEKDNNNDGIADFLYKYVL